MMIDENIGSVWYQEVEEGEFSGPLSMKRKIGVTWLKYQFWIKSKLMYLVLQFRIYNKTYDLHTVGLVFS